ncbi:MAG: CTP synthase [Candidatus Woesearchaeota archaeon]
MITPKASKKKTKYIAITGGVLSGLGKGTVTASIGLILKEQGYNVNMMKIDPYINVDAGTMRPTEHGEVFVTYDGGETDQDIGTYERFIGKSFSRDNNITTGQVYQTVIERERNLEYKGQCVEVIPHIPDEVKRRIRDSSEKNDADFTLIEVGGTVGDYQNVLFLEALREMRLEQEDIMFIHVVYLPIPGNLGEMKTKPAQHSVRSLNSHGIQPNFIITRSSQDLDDVRKKKISMFCNVSHDNVISSPDRKYIYEVPLVFKDQGLNKKIIDYFGLEYKKNTLDELSSFVESIKTLEKKVTIGIVGKYFDIGNFVLEDSYISVIEAVKHACFNNSVIPDIRWINSKEFEKDHDSVSSLDKYDAVIVPGGFGSSGVEGKISAIKYCRENKIPYLGLCYGMQLAVAEYARNVCGMEGAISTEIDPDTKYPIIDILEEQKEILMNNNYGNTMRLGDYPAKLLEGSKVEGFYDKNEIRERHRHRYELNPEYISELEKHGLVFSGKSPDRSLMEFMELPDHPFFIATQAHPEFKTSIMKPAPLFDGLIKAAKTKN